MMLAFAMTNPGYAFLIVLTVVCGIYYTVMVWANAWQARGVEREKTRQEEIKARVKEGRMALGVLNPPLPPLPPPGGRKDKKG